MAVSADEKKKCTLCKEIVKPLTMSNVAFHYIPILGAANYATLSVNVMHPSLITRIIPSRDVTNVLLANSVVGSAFYIYNRPHLKAATQQTRLLYSGFNAVMFNFGSVLVWAVMRTVTKSNCIATIVGLLTGCGMAMAGRNCLKYIDNQVDKEQPSTSK